MAKWIFATVVFGIFAVLFALLYIRSLHGVEINGVQILYSPAAARNFTNAEYTAKLGIGALAFALGCLGSFVAIFAPRGGTQQLDGDDAPSDDAEESSAASWICPHCGEKSPGNFEECWKCQRSRPAQKSA
jgi:hypothetical protein